MSPTIEQLRDVLLRKHRDACLEIHRLVAETEDLSNEAWPDLIKARKREADAAADICRLNDLVKTFNRTAP